MALHTRGECVGNTAPQLTNGQQAHHISSCICAAMISQFYTVMPPEHVCPCGMQDIRQQRLESDKEMYARRLQRERMEAEQKAAEANKRCPCITVSLCVARIDCLCISVSLCAAHMLCPQHSQPADQKNGRRYVVAAIVCVCLRP